MSMNRGNVAHPTAPLASLVLTLKLRKVLLSTFSLSILFCLGIMSDTKANSTSCAVVSPVVCCCNLTISVYFTAFLSRDLMSDTRNDPHCCVRARTLDFQYALNCSKMPSSFIVFLLFCCCCVCHVYSLCHLLHFFSAFQ
jgi:hypothetical protein